jgi:hypothetical protein
VNKFIHNSTLGFSVAYEVADNSVAFAVAFCSPNDTFSKKIGRKVAAGRLELGLAGSDRRKIQDYFFIENLRKDEKPAEHVRNRVLELFVHDDEEVIGFEAAFPVGVS